MTPQTNRCVAGVAPLPGMGYNVDVTRLRGAIQLIVRTYPNPDALTLGRLSKILFLADWYALQESGESVTGLVWLFDERGPTADEVTVAIHDAMHFRLRPVTNVYHVESNAIDALDDDGVQDVPTRLRGAIERAVHLAVTAAWPVFLATILDTPPLLETARGEHVDLRPYARVTGLPGAA